MKTITVLLGLIYIAMISVNIKDWVQLNLKYASRVRNVQKLLIMNLTVSGFVGIALIILLHCAFDFPPAASRFWPSLQTRVCVYVMLPWFASFLFQLVCEQKRKYAYILEQTRR